MTLNAIITHMQRGCLVITAYLTTLQFTFWVGRCCSDSWLQLGYHCSFGLVLKAKTLGF